MQETLKLLCKIIVDNNEKMANLNKAYFQALDTINEYKIKVAELETKIKYLQK